MIKCVSYVDVIYCPLVHHSYRIRISGTYKVSNTARFYELRHTYPTLQDVKVLNSPARTYSVSNPAALVMTGLTIDNCTPPCPKVHPLPLF